jgi:RND superfamily putative drug exporter
MRSLARWCFTHKFIVLGVWIVALVGIGGLNASAGSGYTDSFSLPGTESTTALTLLQDNFNTESTDTNQIVFAADDVRSGDARTRIEETLKKVADGPHVERVDSPFAKGAAAQQISKDGTVAFANVHMDGEQPIADVPKSAYDKLIATAEDARGDGLRVELGGSGIQQATQQPGGGPSEFIGFLAAAIVLAIAFGSLWATLPAALHRPVSRSGAA